MVVWLPNSETHIPKTAGNSLNLYKNKIEKKTGIIQDTGHGNGKALFFISIAKLALYL